MRGSAARGGKPWWAGGGGQVAGLKLEYNRLEGALSERDGAIAALRSQLRKAAAAVKATATCHAAEAKELRHQLQQVPPLPHVLPDHHPDPAGLPTGSFPSAQISVQTARCNALHTAASTW